MDGESLSNGHLHLQLLLRSFEHSNRDTYDAARVNIFHQLSSSTTTVDCSSMWRFLFSFTEETMRIPFNFLANNVYESGNYNLLLKLNSFVENKTYL